VTARGGGAYFNVILCIYKKQDNHVGTENYESESYKKIEKREQSLWV